MLQLFYDTRPTTAPAETLRRSPSRLCAENPRDVAGLDVETVVQGATTEEQTVHTALDGAYLDGSYYELQRGTERAARLDWVVGLGQRRRVYARAVAEHGGALGR